MHNFDTVTTPRSGYEPVSSSTTIMTALVAAWPIGKVMSNYALRATKRAVTVAKPPEQQ